MKLIQKTSRRPTKRYKKHSNETRPALDIKVKATGGDAHNSRASPLASAWPITLFQDRARPFPKSNPTTEHWLWMDALEHSDLISQHIRLNIKKYQNINFSTAPNCAASPPAIDLEINSGAWSTGRPSHQKWTTPVAPMTFFFGLICRMYIQTSGYTPLWLLIICSDWYFVISFTGSEQGGSEVKVNKQSAAKGASPQHRDKEHLPSELPKHWSQGSAARICSNLAWMWGRTFKAILIFEKGKEGADKVEFPGQKATTATLLKK